MHLLVGGQLLTGLRAHGVTTSEVTDVICSHLHADHVGWLFDLAANPIFPRATIWYGAGDFHHFVTGAGAMSSHIRQGFTEPGNETRLRLIDRDTTIAPGITAMLAPGHTPGHLCVVISSGQERALLLGDAVTCPVQLDEPTWHSNRSRLTLPRTPIRTRTPRHSPPLGHLNEAIALLHDTAVHSESIIQNAFAVPAST